MMVHIEIRKGWNNTNSSTALVVWHDAYKVKDALKADGYIYNGYWQTWEKPAADFLNGMVETVINCKLAPSIVFDVMQEARDNGIDMTIDESIRSRFQDYTTKYYA